MTGRGARVALIGLDDPAWDAWLEGRAADVYHLAGYHRFARDSGQGEPFLAVVGDRRRGLAWPYLLSSVATAPGLAGVDRTDVGSVYGYPGPVAWGCGPGDSFVAEAWRGIVGAWRAQGAVTAFTRFHPLLGNARLVSGLDGPGAGGSEDETVVAGGPTISLDCTLDDETAVGAYSRSHRQHVAAALRAGVVTAEDERWDELGTFARLYEATMVRAGASTDYFFDEPDFRRLRDALDGRIHLLVTRVGRTVIAAGLFTERDGIVQAHLIGSDAEHRALSPSTALLDGGRRWAHARGDRVLHLGGGRGGREDSLFQFKRGFSDRRHEFRTGRWVLDRPAYAALVAARLAAAAPGARLDDSFFPAYRSTISVPDGELLARAGGSMALAARMRSDDRGIDSARAGGGRP